MCPIADKLTGNTKAVSNIILLKIDATKSRAVEANQVPHLVEPRMKGRSSGIALWARWESPVDTDYDRQDRLAVRQKGLNNLEVSSRRCSFLHVILAESVC